MFVGVELNEDDLKKLEEIKEQIGQGKLNLTTSAVLRYLIREYAVIPKTITGSGKMDWINISNLIYPDTAD